MTPEQQLKDWVALRHQGQVIRRTGAPYFDHLIAVAEMTKPVLALGYEIGLCHDVLEDTDTTAAELLTALIGFGYTDAEANLISSCVVELTDVFTAAAYPDLSKKARKELESARLLTISPAAQTVKYSDLIYNIDWVLKYDQKHAEAYLLKKQLLLAGLNKGDEALRQRALNEIHRGLILAWRLKN